MERESSLGGRLRRLMEEEGLSYEQLGERLGMNPQTLNRYVLGQREPKIGTASAMAAALGVDPLWLLGYDVPRRTGQRQSVPILGTIRAGLPMAAEQRVEGWATADVAEPEEHFVLRVTGDSMINAGIFDGDQVLVKQQATAENGDMVVALVDDSATVKTFYKENGYYRLQPENDNMDPIIVTGNLQILGKVFGVFRFFQ